MEPFASAGLSKPTGYNTTNPTWSHIPCTHTANFSFEVATGNDREGIHGWRYSKSWFSLFLFIWDFGAFVDQLSLACTNCHIPVTSWSLMFCATWSCSQSKTYYTNFKTEQLIHHLSLGLSYLGDVLDVVIVKLANQERLSISEDRNLPPCSVRLRQKGPI